MKNIMWCVWVCVLLAACKKKDRGAIDTTRTVTTTVDNFNRRAMLENWADNIIVPAYIHTVAQLKKLQTAASAFTSTPDATRLTALRTAWWNAYIAWQSVAMFNIGKAEMGRLRSYMNVFPTDAAEISKIILVGTYDLTSVNRQDEQGFPALGYLLHGLAASDAGIVAFYTGTNGSQYKKYVTDVVGRMLTLTQSVLDDWNNKYRNTFVGSDKNFATSSVNAMVNDYVFYFEKYLRAGKVGIPAGVFSAGTTHPNKVEAYYAKKSKTLFLAALQAAQDFFNGKHFGKTTTGQSLKQYLDALNTIKKENQSSLATLIDRQFNAASKQARSLDEDFAQQVRTNNTLMLSTYEKLQANVILLKVDMLSALSVRVDYMDADGD